MTTTKKLVVVLLGCLFGAALCLSQEQEQLFLVRGKVIDPATNAGIGGATVSLIWMDRPPAPGEVYEPLVSETASDGSFRFEVEPLGRFALEARHSDYRRVPESNRVSEATPGAPAFEAVLYLSHGSGIRGRLVDAASGEPVPHMAVQARRRGEDYFVGDDVMRGFSTVSTATTEEEGQFEIWRLTAGAYYLTTYPVDQESVGEPTETDDFANEVEMGYAAIYWYPGVQQYEGSVPVTAPASGVLEGIEMAVEPVPTPAIRGRVLGDSIEGEAELYMCGGRIWPSTECGVRARVKIGEEFQINNLFPGNYWMYASTLDEDPATRRSGTHGFYLSERNMEGVDVSLHAPVNVTGTVKLEGRDAGMASRQYPGTISVSRSPHTR